MSSFGSDPHLSISEHVRGYRDDALLDRVSHRLELSRRRQRARYPLVTATRSAVLVAAGVLLGMWIQTAREPQTLATAEPQLLMSGPAPAPLAQSSRREVQLVKSRSEGEPRDEPRSRLGRGYRGSSAHGTRGVAESSDQETQLEELPLLGPEPIIPPVRSTWLLLADRGDFAGAFQQLDETGGFDSVLASGTPEELMTLVDIARVMGRQGRAIQALRVVTERYQSDPNAPLAAMMLGNLLSRVGDAGGASKAFALNRRLSPDGDFAEDALMREFDMAVARADLPLAERLMQQYGEEFPGGEHLEELRAEVTRLAETTVARSSADEGQSMVSGQAAQSEKPLPGSKSSRSRRDLSHQESTELDPAELDPAERQSPERQPPEPQSTELDLTEHATVSSDESE